MLASLAALRVRAAPAADGSMIVTLLGTGGPGPSPVRFGPATLVQAGKTTLMFDAGRGCTIRCQQIGVGLAALDGVFITHYHSDHINGLFDVFTLGYLARRPPNADAAMRSIRTKPLRLWGPKGLEQIAQGLQTAAKADIDIRTADEKVNPAAARFETHPFAHDGVIFDEAGVKVTAFAVDHGALVKPAYGYRVDYAGHAVLISGDTRLSENLIAHGVGLDLLVHSVAGIAPKWTNDLDAMATASHQSSPEDCAAVFGRTKPKMAALTHILTIGTTPDEIRERISARYDGPLAMGEDLMRFVITDGVVMQRWNQQTRNYAAPRLGEGDPS
jgi:ribonuclease Z